jgi:CheY-like chemotaxis protein
MGGDLVLLPSERGAQFRLSLDAPVAVAGATTPQSGTPDLSGRTILVVDDITTNRLVAASFLKAGGARVIEADSGETALAVLARDSVDLVLLDMNMPGLDGVATFRAIRRMDGTAARVPVIAMTADVLPTQRAQIDAEGLNGYLPKPLIAEDLYALLDQQLPA